MPDEIKSYGSLILDDVRLGSGASVSDNGEGIDYENKRAENQSLTFEYLRKRLEEKGIIPSKGLFSSLGLVNESLFYTNLALLLSEQSTHSVKVSVFQGDSKTKYLDHVEFKGSALRQFDEVCEYITSRYTEEQYPRVAVTEAICNAIVHKNYYFNGSVLVNIYDSGIEILSTGGLIGQITPMDILVGMSQPRNKKLVDIFTMLTDIGTSGTGFSRISDGYRKSGAKLTVRVSDNVFILKMPNINTALSNLGSREKSILEYILENSSITRKQAQELLGVSQTLAGRVLSNLVALGHIKKTGGSMNIKYIV